MLMGRELERVSAVHAGCVFGIGGVDDIILKTATLSSTKLCPPFSNMVFGVSKDFHYPSNRQNRILILFDIVFSNRSGSYRVEEPR
mgnify:CR=1 FL=1